MEVVFQGQAIRQEGQEMKPEPRPLYIAISPYGVYIQFCTKCEHGKFLPVEDNKYLACEKCGAKIAIYDAKHTAQLENVGGNETVH